MICDIICVDGFLCMLHLDIVHMLSAYVHVIHTLSGHMRIMRTLFAVVLDIFLPNRQCWCHPYVISSIIYISYHIKLSFCTLSTQTYIVNAICWCHPYVISSIIYISYHIKLSFCTLSTQTYIVNAIWMLSAHVHIICLSSLTLLIYLIIHNLVFAHCLHTHKLSMSSLYCLQMHNLCKSHFYYCYLHMYMSSAYLRIYILCAHYVQWSLTCFFLTDNAVDHNYLSTLTGTGYWIEFVTRILSCFISGSCKWFVT